MTKSTELPDREHSRGWDDVKNPKSGPIAIIAANESDAKLHPQDHPARWSRQWWHSLTSQFLKFGLVGGLGIVVDLGVFNALRLTVLAPEVVSWGPMAANIIGTLVAILFNWVGNRLWTFRHDRHHNSTWQEAVEFLLVSLAGLVISLIPLWITHYLFDWTSPLSDNIAKLVGIGVGSIFRFALYRWWVYSPARIRANEPADS